MLAKKLMSNPPEYEHLSDEVLSRHFMPRLAVPDHELWLAGDAALSAQTKQRLRPLADQRYGPGPRQVADLYPATTPNAPLLVFFHGGYWRALSKDHVAYVAGPLAQAGVAAVIPNYDLCPTVTLADVVDEANQAVAFALAKAKELNADPDRLFLAGNSAGAHLAAMMLALGHLPGKNIADKVRGVFLVTGIYDLRPLLRVQVNEDTRLSQEAAVRLSPQLLPMPGGAKAFLAVGAREPPLWIDQSQRFATKLKAEGHWSELMIVPRMHHFSLTRSLADPDSPLCRTLTEFMQ